MRRRLLGASLVCLTAIGLGAGTASAAVFCVNKNPCFGGFGSNKATIQEAFDAAEISVEADKVLIDANGSTPYVESPVYNDPGKVEVIGDGVGQTIIQGPVSSTNAVTLLSPTSTIEDLTIRAPDESNGAALRWDGTASNIEAVHLGSTVTETNGMVAEGNAVLQNSTVDINGTRLFTASGAANATIAASSLIGGGSGIDVGGAGLTLERSSVISKRSAVEAGFGSAVSIFNTVLRMGESQAADGAVSILPGGEAEIRHATLIGGGFGRGVSVAADTNSATVSLFDSIIYDFATALFCAGEPANIATLNVSYSNWTDPTDLTDGECEGVLVNNDEVTEPVFVSTNPLLPNYRLRAPSPLIDAAGPSDPLTEDLVGAPRVVDGDGVEGARSDMGAYEYQRQAPIALIGSTGTGEHSVSFSATGSFDPDPGDTLTYSWDFGDGSTATGFSVEHTFAGTGPYTIKLTATDPTGLTGTGAMGITFNPFESPAPTQPGKGPKKPKKPKPKAGPTISELRAAPRRIRRGKGLPKLVKGLKRPGFQFKISRKAEVRLTLVRCKGKRGCRKRVRVRGAAAFNAFAGANTIKFRGRLTGPKLRRGRYRATLRAAGGNSQSTPFRLIR